MNLQKVYTVLLTAALAAAETGIRSCLVVDTLVEMER